ncbi:hypothetical protein [Nocardiopsis ansamitocini]|uniref:Asp23/Gls24 family envelope stress response protein n=1 Tax=Nocardiopsis ansamitocini TaxID=1670832 RepID=A0A9W6UJ28_9ACTN|nr:hypothetical protein [Nocardiopsis ansamitocini]GLU47630.1 hypothetical protein Nans01_19810 [Nocardiopsis ansamitocini]
MAVEHTEPDPTLDSARDELREERVTAPPQLLDNVMNTVRREGRSTRVLDVPSTRSLPDNGHTQVRESVAAKILRMAADRTPGLRVGRCQIGEAETEGYSVRLTVRADTGTPIPEAAEVLRRSVLSAARNQLGWVIARVDIDIADIV